MSIYKNFNLGDGLQTKSSKYLMKPSECVVAVNAVSEKIGSFEKRKEEVVKGSQVGAGEIRGIGGYYDGTNRILMAFFGTTSYEFGTDWGVSVPAPAFAGASRRRLLNFLGHAFVFSNVEDIKAYNGSAWKTTANYPLLDCPADLRNGIVYKSRLLGISPSKNLIYHTTEPINEITLVDGAHSAVTVLNVYETRLLKAGMKIDIYTSFTNTRVVDSGVISTVDSDTQVTLSAAVTVADQDEIYIEDMKGTKVCLWDSTHQTISAGYNDGEALMGLGLTPSFFIVLKEESIHVGNLSQCKPVSNKIGCSARDSIDADGTFTYWLDEKGVYRISDECVPTCISNGIGDYIEAITSANLTNAIGGILDGHYYLFVGDLSKFSLTNVLLDFDLDSGNVWLHTLPFVITAMSRFLESGRNVLYIGTSTGYVYKLFAQGNSSTTICMRVEKGTESLDTPSVYDFIDSFVILSNKAKGTEVYLRIDSADEAKFLGTISDDICELKCQEKVKHFNLIFVHSAIGTPRIEGYEVLSRETGEV